MAHKPYETHSATPGDPAGQQRRSDGRAATRTDGNSSLSERSFGVSIETSERNIRAEAKTRLVGTRNSTARTTTRTIGQEEWMIELPEVYG
ncbi:hypothetical protein RUM43_006347 [Polyplax serrata]|uniref:Uncharacterized protein n=1 Tax=Polyplax serrata TaxID=468196 RepID=A0AAN8NT30_POLSC